MTRWVLSPVIVLAVAGLGAWLSWWLVVRALQADQTVPIYLGTFLIQGLVVGAATILLTKTERDEARTIVVVHLRQSALVYALEVYLLYGWFTLGGWRIFVEYPLVCGLAALCANLLFIVAFRGRTAGVEA
jgi:hypothetical protein